MHRPLDDNDSQLVYVDKFREYGVRILDGGSSYVQIGFCPFCGDELPPSMRDAWFERLDEIGIDEGGADVPTEMLDGTWWRTAK